MQKDCVTAGFNKIRYLANLVTQCQKDCVTDFFNYIINLEHFVTQWGLLCNRNILNKFNGLYTETVQGVTQSRYGL